LISAGAVGATFTIENLASATLKKLLDEFVALQGAVDKTIASLKELRLAPGLASGVAKLDKSITSLAVSAEGMSTKVTAGFGEIDAAISTTQGRLAALKAEMREVGAVGVGAGPRTASNGGGGGRGRGGMFRHSGSGAGAEMAGVVTLAVGYEVIKNVLAEGGALELQKKLLRDRLGTGGTEADISGATALAIQYATGGANGIIGTTPAQNLKGITELLSVTPNLKAAEELYPGVMRAATALHELTGQPAEDTMKVLAKGIENTGGGINPKTGELDTDRMQLAVNAAVKTIIAGGGFIDAATLFGYAKQAGGMGRITTDLDAAQNQIITALIDMGGNRTGTAMAALGRQFLGDKMTVQTADQLEALGILAPGSWKKAGGTGIVMNPGFDVKGIDEIKDPNKGIGAWLNDIWAPALKEKFLKEGKDFSPANIMQESYRDFGQQTGQRLGLMFLMNKAQQDRDIALRMGVDPSAVVKGITSNDYAANLDNLGKSITSFAQVLGGPSIPLAIGGVQMITGAVQGLTKAAAVSPDADRIALGGIFGPAMFAGVYNAVKDLWSHLPGAGGPGPQSANTRSAHPYLNNQDLQGIGNERPVTSTANVKVDVWLDTELVATKIMSQIESALRLPGSSAGADGSANHMPPDSYNF
jgi:hypothetical protein